MFHLNNYEMTQLWISLFSWSLFKEMSVQIRNTGLIRSKAAPLLLSLDTREQAELLLNHQNVCIYRHYWSVHQLQYVLVTNTTCWNLFKPDAQWSEGDVFCRIGGSCVLRVFCTLGIHCSTHRELYDVRMICWWRVPLIPGLVFFFFFWRRLCRVSNPKQYWIPHAWNYFAYSAPPNPDRG